MSADVAQLEREVARLVGLYSAATEFSFRVRGGGVVTVVQAPRDRKHFYVLDVNGDEMPSPKPLTKDEAIAVAMRSSEGGGEDGP